MLPSENEGNFDVEIDVEVSSVVSSVTATLNHELMEPIIMTLDPENGFSNIEEIEENSTPYTIPRRGSGTRRRRSREMQRLSSIWVSCTI